MTKKVATTTMKKKKQQTHRGELQLAQRKARRNTKRS